VRTTVGLFIILLSIWGGAYFGHLFWAQDWLVGAITATAALTGIVGIIVLCSSLYTPGQPFDEDEEFDNDYI
jgi:hypothetical protein